MSTGLVPGSKEWGICQEVGLLRVTSSGAWASGGNLLLC